jgi:putative oxidoreductase
MTSTLDSFRPHAHWALRIGLASVFLFHGVGKAVSIEGFSQMMGMPFGIAALVTFAEVAAGVGIIAGGFKSALITRLSAIAMAPVLLGAILMVHWGRWSFTPADGFPMGGMEFQFVLFMSALYFLVVGNSTSGQSA